MSALPEPVQAIAEVPLSPRERALDEAPTWPTTRLVGVSLTLALYVSVFAPAAASSPHRLGWLSLALPAIAATLAARAVFEVLGFAAPSIRFGRQLAVSVPPALLAAAAMALAGTIVGAPWSTPVGAATVAMVMTTLVGAGAARSVEVRFQLGMRRVFFVGSMESLADLEREVERRRHSALVGAITVGTAPATIKKDELVETVVVTRATAVVLDGYAMRQPELVEAAAQLNFAGMRIRDLVSHYEDEFKKVPLAELSPTWFLFDIASIHSHRNYGRVRRTLDVALASVMLALVLPLLAFAAVLIKLTSRGPAIYRQRRVGLNGAPFTLLKLRTMREDETAQAHASWAGAQAHRVTPVGRVLRRFRIDELPQFWNVVRGDLALIGPRPEQVPIVERLNKKLPYYGSRHCIRPGITGWAQVNVGYGGSDEGTVAKLQRDLYYVKHHGPRLDLLIMWLTIKAILAGPHISPRPALKRAPSPESAGS